MSHPVGGYPFLGINPCVQASIQCLRRCLFRLCFQSFDTLPHLVDFLFELIEQLLPICHETTSHSNDYPFTAVCTISLQPLCHTRPKFLIYCFYIT